MTEKTNDGGQAFPCPQDPISQNVPSLGMTLRDYFAAKAPMPTNEWWVESCSQSGKMQSQADVIARWAFAYADAMLAARSAS